MVRRFGVETITGVNASEGMLERFSAKLGSEFPDVQVELRTEDVMEMGVPDGEFDAVLCAMALHWFADKTAAVARMARALRPGGVLGILMVGRGGEDSWRELLEQVNAPAEWTGWFAKNQRDVNEIDADLRAAEASSPRRLDGAAAAPHGPGRVHGPHPLCRGTLARQPARRSQRVGPTDREGAARRRQAPTGSPTTTASSTRWRASPRTDAGRR